MLDLKATWNQLINDLERERDELRLKIHLGKVEARDMLAKVDHKLDNLRLRAGKILDSAQDSAGNVQDSAKALVTEIQEGLKRVRKLL